MLLTVIIFIITLLTLVVIHELGHFLVAKKFGIKVEEFGFGIPPRAWGKKVGETLVSINWLPFGGFVRLMGEDETDKKTLNDPRSFASAAVHKRIAVVVAGVVMNLLLAWLIFYITLGVQGFKADFPIFPGLNYHFFGASQTSESVILIQAVTSGSPADVANLKPGDRVLAINNQEVKESQELISQTKKLAGEEIKLTISDPEKQNIREVRVTPRKDPPVGQGPLGVGLGELGLTHIEYATLPQKLLAGPTHSVNLVAYSGEIIAKLAAQSIQTRKVEPVAQTVSGPVGITNVVNDILTTSKKPLLSYLDFIGILSLNLAVMNVLPFPALDGGRLFFLFIEAVTRKKVHASFEKWVHTIGMVVLLTLMIAVTFSDISKILPH
jgi:regulator of sigma E protease